MSQTANGSGDALQELTALLAARYTLLLVPTQEEERIERLVAQAAKRLKYEVEFWDCYRGPTDLTGARLNPNPNGRDPNQQINRIDTATSRTVYVLRDLGTFWNQATIRRGLRSLARELKNSPRDQARTIILVGPDRELPPELKGDCAIVDLPLPNRRELGELLDVAIKDSEALQAKLAENGNRESAIDAALGLTSQQALDCFAKSIAISKEIDPAVIVQEKKRVIKDVAGLTWVEPDPRGFEGVAGLGKVKRFAGVRKKALSEKAREFGLPVPKGILLAGVPGCGKSLTAKCWASGWGLPLLRGDMNSTKEKWVGGSESNIRQMFAVAETAAPCVLHLDEIEKAIGGNSAQSADGGVSSDFVGFFLTWLQEHTEPVFVIATCNDVEQLPAELLRKGRFDELFWVDTPTAEERRAILEVTIRKLGRDPKEVGDLDKLVRESEGWIGAELAAVVEEGLFAAFDEERELTVLDVEAAAKDVVPFTETAKERVEGLREWSKGRAKPASDPEERLASTAGRAIDEI